MLHEPKCFIFDVLITKLLINLSENMLPNLAFIARIGAWKLSGMHYNTFFI